MRQVTSLNININGTNETYNGEIPVSALSAGSRTSGTFFRTPKKEGQIEIKAIVDATGVVSEAEENNNELIKTATISKGTVSSNSEESKEIVSSSSEESGSSEISSSSEGSNIISKEPLSNIDARDFSTRNIASDYHVKFDFTENNTCITYLEFDPTKIL